MDLDVLLHRFQKQGLSKLKKLQTYLEKVNKEGKALERRKDFAR